MNWTPLYIILSCISGMIFGLVLARIEPRTSKPTSPARAPIPPAPSWFSVRLNEGSEELDEALRLLIGMNSEITRAFNHVFNHLPELLHILPQLREAPVLIPRLLYHYAQDYAVLKSALVHPKLLRWDSRRECLIHLAVDHRIISWQDHDSLPNWVEVMKLLLKHSDQVTKPETPESDSSMGPKNRFDRGEII